MCCSKTHEDLCSPQSKNRYIQIYNINAQGLHEANHHDNIILQIKNIQPDIITIQETWLRSYHTNKSVEIPSYNILRCDRKGTKSDRGKGGGAAIYVKSTYKTKKISCANTTFLPNKLIGVEFIAIEIVTKFAKMLVCTLYRVNTCSNDDFTLLISHILEISINYDHVIITGDFNINTFDDKKAFILKPINDVFYLCNDECPTYSVANFKPSRIDLIYSKCKHRIISYNHFNSTGVSHHQSQLVQYNILPNKATKQLYTFRSYNKVNADEYIYVLY